MQKTLRWLDRYWIGLLVLTGGVTYGIIMMVSLGQSVWFDEGYSISLAQQSYGELLALTAVDAHPPFYYLLLKIWGELFGFHEFALRSLSAVCMAGAIMVMMALTRRLFGMRAMVLAIPAFLLAPFLLRYGYEIRMYALATLISVLATYVMVRALASAQKAFWWWSAYAVLVALGMYTLYMMAAVWVAHAVWLLWCSLREHIPFLKWRWMYAYVGAVVLFVPYLPTFLWQFSHSALPGIGREVTLTTLGDTVSALVFFTPEWLLGGWLTILLVIGGVLLATVGVKGVRRLSRSQQASFMLYAALALIPIIFFALISLPPREPIYVVRYMAHVAIWIYGIVAVIMAFSWGRVRKGLWIATASVLLVMGSIGVGIMTVRGNYIFERDQTPMTQQIQKAIECDENTVVIADDPYTYIDAVYELGGCKVLFYASEDVEKKGGYAPLHGSRDRVVSSDVIDRQRIIHLHWGEPTFRIDERYQLESRTLYGKQYVDLYELR